jgi:ribonuclease H2 subunit C
VLQSTDKTIPRTRDACRSQGEDQDGDMDDEEDDEETKITEQVATFDEVVVWEHGARVDVERDAYVRGLGEWVEWAGVMHAKDEDEGEGGEDGGEKA